MKAITVSIGPSASDTRNTHGVNIAGTVFAITKPIGYKERWSLTHLPTGWRVCGGSSQAKLRTIAKRLNELPTASLTDPALIKADAEEWKSIIQAGR